MSDARERRALMRRLAVIVLAMENGDKNKFLKKTKIARGTLSYALSEKNFTFSIATARAIKRAYLISLDYILDGDARAEPAELYDAIEMTADQSTDEMVERLRNWKSVSIAERERRQNPSDSDVGKK